MSPARQLFSMLAGIFLYGVLYYFIVHLALQNKPFASEALFGLSIVVPMFFGAAFGPAVGLVTAIGGYLIGHNFLGAQQSIRLGCSVRGFGHGRLPLQHQCEAIRGLQEIH